MKLPDKDDPHGDKEGSMPTQIVLDVLREHDVEVQLVAPNTYMLSAGDQLTVQVFESRVGGRMIRRLSHMFQIEQPWFRVAALTGKPRAQKH